VEYGCENWIDHFSGILPHGRYSMHLELSDEKGLIVHLQSDQCSILLDFGVIYGINVLEEGVQLNDLPNCTYEMDSLPHSSYESVIYLIQNGRYEQYIKLCMGNELFDFLQLHQINVVAQNYVAMIVCNGVPKIYTYYK
jgi:hypothetical protein